MNDDNKYESEDIGGGSDNEKGTPDIEQPKDDSVVSDLLNAIGFSSLLKRKKSKPKDTDTKPSRSDVSERPARPDESKPTEIAVEDIGYSTESLKLLNESKSVENTEPALSDDKYVTALPDDNALGTKPVTLGELIKAKVKNDVSLIGETVADESPIDGISAADESSEDVLNLINDAETLQAYRTRLISTFRLICREYSDDADLSGKTVTDDEALYNHELILRKKKRSKFYKITLPVTAIIVVASLLIYNNWAFLWAFVTEPWPPGEDVVASYNGKYITIDDLKDFLAIEKVREWEHQYCDTHGYDHDKCEDTEDCEMHPIDSLEGYQELINMMVTERIIMEWAEKQGITQRDDVRHGLKDLMDDASVQQLVAQIRERELTAESIPKWEVQQYYDENRSEYGDREFSEVEHEIRDILATKKGEEFFPQYIEDLKKSAGLEVNFDLLKVSEPTTEDINAYYQKNAADYQTPEKAEILEIKFASSTKAEEAVRKLGSGESFDNVAAAYGQSGKAETRTLQKGSGDAPLETAAWKMVPGKVSDPITTADGSISIIKLVSITPAGTKKLSEVREEIVTVLRRENIDKEYTLRKSEALFSVHSKRYTLGDFHTEFKELPEQYQIAFSTFETKKQLLEQFIAKELLLEEVGDGSDTGDQHKTEELKIQYLYQIMHQDEVEGNLSDPTEEEILQFYNENKSQLVEAARVKVSLIWIDQGLDAEKKEQARKKADEALSLLNGGTDFVEVAKKYSEDGTAESGGEISQWLYENHLPLELSQSIFALQEGQTSKVIESSDGLYIIKVREKNEQKQLSLEESTDTIKEYLKELKHEQLSTELEDKLLKDSNFIIYNRTIRKMLKAQVKLQSKSKPE